MPVALERKLQHEAAHKFPGDTKRQNAYVYGTLRKTGWTPKVHKKHKQHTGGPHR